MQKFESDLAARVGSLFQQRLALSVENNKLKQKVVKLQQQKIIADGELSWFHMIVSYIISCCAGCWNFQQLLLVLSPNTLSGLNNSPTYFLKYNLGEIMNMKT